MWTMRRPSHWVSDGALAELHDVRLGSAEGAALVGYFLEIMPEGTEVTRVQRWESRGLVMSYASYKQHVCD